MCYDLKTGCTNWKFIAVKPVLQVQRFYPHQSSSQQTWWWGCFSWSNEALILWTGICKVYDSLKEKRQESDKQVASAYEYPSRGTASTPYICTVTYNLAHVTALPGHCESNLPSSTRKLLQNNIIAQKLYHSKQKGLTLKGAIELREVTSLSILSKTCWLWAWISMVIWM